MIARARDGDREALGQLWRAYNHLLLRYFRGKGMAEPDDLASTVWLEVANGLHRFEGGEPDFRRWLFTIAARRRIDDIRCQQAPRPAQRQRHAENGGRPSRPVGRRRVRAGGARSTGRSRSIRSLPPDQAEAVLLRVVADLSVTEVAAILGRREGTVRVLVHRGLKRLAERSVVTESPVQTMSAS